MSKKLFFTGIFLSSILGGLFVYILITNVGMDNGPRRNYVNISNRQEMMGDAEIIVPEGLNFLNATEKVLPAVVHIQSTYSGTSSSPIDRMFGRESASTGSGVIITDDGFIATNYHVIEDARTIDVTLHDNQVFEAEVIGIDETTDLALIKINTHGLKFVRFGDSDDVRLGEWVLAIGNPFNLNSTVTAGIVSAKARNIDIIRSRSNLNIESFIQTDAAVNPGNSGGALVNLRGDLIGINTAIATSSGRFEGYSFAVPVNLVEKVVNDLLEFGETKRGLLGITINDMDARLAERYDIEVLQGVFVAGVSENGAGNQAGLEPGDVIVGINERTVSNVSELQEYVARNRPGDEIEVIYIRDNQEFRVKATLRDIHGRIDLYAANPVWNEVYFEDISFRNEGQLVMGVKILRIRNSHWLEAGVEPGFIITHLNDSPLESTSQLIEMLDQAGDKYSLRGLDEYGRTQLIQIEQ